MNYESLIQASMFVIAPFLAVILICMVLILAMRGGRPFKFTASGFGVQIDFNTQPVPESNKGSNTNGIE